MRLFLDTNVFVAVVTDEPKTAAHAEALLDSDHDLLTSTLNLMELRTVLTKKNRLELDRAQRIQREITSYLPGYASESPHARTLDSYHAKKN